MVAASMYKPTRRVPPFFGVSLGPARPAPREASSAAGASAPEASVVCRKMRREMSLAAIRLLRLEPTLVDLEAEPVPPDQLVVGQPGLQVLADHVHVLEVALDRVAVVHRGRAGQIVDHVHHPDREADPF